MRRRRTAVMGEDTRKVAIYTRKSVITNKGDSIGVQMKQDLSQVKKKLTDFKESWKTATPEELMSMVRAVVERVYVVYEDEEPIAHIRWLQPSGEEGHPYRWTDRSGQIDKGSGTGSF